MSVTLNRSKVMEYVRKYWNNPNKKFKYFDGNDCTNFVSQCWNYGGISITEEWSPYFPEVPKPLKSGTLSWINVDYFTEYFTTGDDPIAEIKWSSTEARVGDVIQFYNGETWTHAGIVSGFDPTYGLTYACHSSNHLQKPLSDVYLKIYPAVRFICPKSSVD